MALGRESYFDDEYETEFTLPRIERMRWVSMLDHECAVDAATAQ